MDCLRFRRFAGNHLPMLWWLCAVAIATIGVTLVLRTTLPDAILALLAVPLVLMAGASAALSEIIHALRQYQGEPRQVITPVIGTIMVGISGLPLMIMLAFATSWVADFATLMRDLPRYRQIVAEVQSGGFVSAGEWQSRGGTDFLVDSYPRLRIVFTTAAARDRHNAIVYDPSGRVAVTNKVAETLNDPQHHIGGVMLEKCRATPVSAYYRCDIWELEADEIE